MFSGTTMSRCCFLPTTLCSCHSSEKVVVTPILQLQKWGSET